MISCRLLLLIIELQLLTFKNIFNLLMHNTQILSESRNFVILRCLSCNKIHIRHRNFILDLDIEKYRLLYKYLLETDFNKHAENCRGTRQIILQTNSLNFRVCLCEDEFIDLKRLCSIAESKLRRSRPRKHRMSRSYSAIDRLLSDFAAESLN